MNYKRAMIIEDEVDICILLSGFLEKNSFITSYSTTIQEGLVKIIDFKPEILFLDNNLPDGSGIEILPQIKKTFPNLKIIVISALSNMKEIALFNGANGFLSKPISFAHLSEYL